MPTTYFDPIEILHNLRMEGSLTADVYEVSEPDPNTTNLIRFDQAWGIKVKWEIRGYLSHLLHGEWRVQALLERIGKDTPAATDYDLPFVTVIYSSGTYNPADRQMLWDVDVKIKAKEVLPGAYKLVTLLQLYDDGLPTAIAGMEEQRGIINVFDPG